MIDQDGHERRFRRGDTANFGELKGGEYFFEGDQLWQKGHDDGTNASRVSPRVEKSKGANYGVFLPSTRVVRAVEIT